MAKATTFDESPQQHLLKEIKSARSVMLGSTNIDEHMQPMTPQVDVDESVIYFFADRFSQLGKTIGVNPGTVELCHITKDFQASIKGRLTTHNDADIIDKYWSPIVEAWYPEGKADPKLILLKFVPQKAAIWTSDKNVFSFLYEITKANISNETPDIGDRKTIEM